MTVSDSAGSFTQVQVSNEKNYVVACGLRKCMSTQVVDLSTLAMLASVTGFIPHCFQLRESNGAVATGD